MRASPVRRHSVLVILLIISNLYLPFHLYSHRCIYSRTLHTQLHSTLLSLPSLPSPNTHIPPPSLSHKHIRKLSALLQSFSPCSLETPRHIRRSLEFPLIASTLDPILLYILCIQPPNQKVALEIGGHSLATAPLALFQGFRVVALADTWRSYDVARAFYARHANLMRAMPTASGTAVEAGRLRGNLVQLAKKAGVVRADIILNFAGGGDDFTVLDEIVLFSPTFIVMKYADFVGMSKLGVKGGNAGVVPVVSALGNLGYRLVWCLSTHPIAVFVRDGTAVGLKTVSTRACLRERDGGKVWRRDMEALWDEANEMGWKNFT